MRLFVVALCLPLLAGCGATPVWLTVASAGLTWLASVNNLGADLLTSDNGKACLVVPAK